ncbi:hypothetical protein [Kitasatospora sp. DSM 101779]|uniref:hypothetical protein n=1 Tax=Kitasatospora sp. DSM 101779 TaxID=2853165 RepID=UPI0021D9BED0|nr:hypothetical protein [Kitasatospora sp. DSM 101779]MCU7821069.1 hypothetical protein [Kitasatospora sp. DSM 101779]
MDGDAETLGENALRTVGVRSAEDVREALEWLGTCSRIEEIGPGGRGAAAAYRWALDPGSPRPSDGVRGTPAAGPAADRERLGAEERAALAVAHDTARSHEQRDFAHGAAQALGWILGHTGVRF